jgi:hypothetical protein
MVGGLVGALLAWCLVAEPVLTDFWVALEDSDVIDQAWPFEVLFWLPLGVVTGVLAGASGGVVARVLLGLDGH